ncbi:nuclear transport factor 2 family protein [Brevundimonas sp. GCM10030266]|uniref:nuclear transport factor 2 family protein n=1 Tax=Brevundimonas sp. GCM10030266 TaxID=3273386 RepID=UPI00362105B2
MPAQSPIPAFLQAFRTRSHDQLAPFLHEEVVYRVEGFAPVVGRREVLAYWRRMFEVHEDVRMSLDRHVRDANLVMVSQRQLYLSGRREPLVLDSMVIYELREDLVLAWTDTVRAGDLAEEDAALWRRLRTARW